MKLKVLNKNILAAPCPLFDEGKDLLVTTCNVDKFKKDIALVKYIGEDVKKIKVDDLIIFKTGDHNQLEIENERFFLITEDEVIAIKYDI
ncbi:MAG: hypothetical protein BWX56_01280 [Euryarchaeota archaeon ADurb.Bin023]|jgi:co-chaperonin GroES (HSP10)|nr:MAG: hypothetical protein BWX56_01280 [Euryarchaeota archaeon ADurb.Bin023]